MRLNKLIGITSAIALVLGGSFASGTKANALDLYPIGTNRTNDVIGLDLDSVTVTDDNRFIMFTMVQTNSPASRRSQGGVTGYIMTWMTDCRTASMRGISSYANNWATPVQTNNTPSEWSTPPQGSIAGQALSIVCER